MTSKLTFEYKQTTTTNLRDVNVGAFGTGDHHSLQVVVFRERLFSGAAGLVTSIVQDSVDLILESLPERVTRRRLELHVVRLLDHLYHVFFRLLDRLLDFQISLRIGDGISDTDAVT